MLMNSLKDIYIYLLRRHYLVFGKKRRETYTYRNVHYTSDLIKDKYTDLLLVYIVELYVTGILIYGLYSILGLEKIIDNIYIMFSSTIPGLIISIMIHIVLWCFYYSFMMQPCVLLNRYLMARSLRSWEIQQQKRDTDPRFR